MAYEPKDMSGTLFQNDKGENSKRPDYRGSAMINGIKYEIAGWTKQGARGAFTSLSFSLPREADTKQLARDFQAPDKTPPKQRDFDDDIDSVPF